MSWNIAIIGTSAAIERELDKHAPTLEGDSRKEYEQALPALFAIVKNNYNTSRNNEAFKLIATGHKYKGVDNEYSYFYVNFEPVGATLV